MEDWVRVRGFPDYSVNRDGEVRRDYTGRILQVKINQRGAPFVGLRRGFVQYQRSLPLIVAKAFLPPYPNEAFDTPINLDGDRLNCAADNLMWRPLWFARKYNQQFKPGHWSYHRTMAVRAIETGEEFSDLLEAAKHFGVLQIDILLGILNKDSVWPVRVHFEEL